MLNLVLARADSTNVIPGWKSSWQGPAQLIFIYIVQFTLYIFFSLSGMIGCQGELILMFCRSVDLGLFQLFKGLFRICSVCLSQVAKLQLYECHSNIK